MGPELAVHANDDSVKATEFRHGYVKPGFRDSPSSIANQFPERWRSAARDRGTSQDAGRHRGPAASRCSGRTFHSEGHPLPSPVNLPGRWGRTPTRIARRLTRQRQLTRAMTDSTRGGRPTRLPTGASTQLQLFSGLKPESPSRCQPSPATLPPSQSQA